MRRRSLISSELTLELFQERTAGERLAVACDQGPCAAGIRQRQNDQTFGMAQPPRCRIDAIEPPMHGIEAVLGGDHDRGALNGNAPTEDHARLLEPATPAAICRARSSAR